jgi:hypothetical protein
MSNCITTWICGCFLLSGECLGVISGIVYFTFYCAPSPSLSLVGERDGSA